MWFFRVEKCGPDSWFSWYGLVICTSVPIDGFWEPQLATKSLCFCFGCHVSGPLRSFKTYILNGQEDLLLFIVHCPCNCLLSLFLPLLKLHNPRSGRQALSVKELVVSTLHYIHVPAISIPLSFSQLCTTLWNAAKEELMLKILFLERSVTSGRKKVTN